jgi:hypothetical protein
MAAKNSMFDPEDTDILQDMYGTDAGRLTEQQEDMFGTGHESATGACSETFGTEADSPKLAKPRWKRGFGQGSRAQSRARAPRPGGADEAARKSRGATALLLAGAITMALLWAVAIAIEGGNNPIAGLFSGRHAENLAPMWQAGEYARMSSYFYVNDLDIYGQEDEMLVPYAQCVEIYALRQDFFGDWYDAVEKGDIDAWGMAYAAQQMLSMQAETGILPGNEEQYALACGEISAFLEAQAGVSTGQLAALSSGDYTTASNARDEVETLLNLAMADAFRQEGAGAWAGGEEGGGAE